MKRGKGKGEGKIREQRRVLSVKVQFFSRMTSFKEMNSEREKSKCELNLNW